MVTGCVEKPRLVLALETSCDETAVAIVSEKGELLASEVSSQIDLHAQYGGVVPEVASRRHLTQLKPLIRTALSKASVAFEQIDAFAATTGPGLATSLMVGVSAAKAMAVSTQKPYLAVNHMEGHLLSPFFGVDVPPSIALVVSGGHTMLVEIEVPNSYRLLGQTVDDAAGEAFDKVGKLLGLPYPGGPQIDRLAATANPSRFEFPRSMLKSEDYNFSFSGLKTAVRYMLPKIVPEDVPDVCASFQEAVMDVLVSKTLRAASATGKKIVSVSGGVSCNRRLRARFTQECARQGLELFLADPKLCTDNAAMIGWVAMERIKAGLFSDLSADIDPNLRLQSA